MQTFLGIDVGTGSARAGVFDAAGRLLGAASEAVTMYRPRNGLAEQSSDQIWDAICRATRSAVGSADISPGDVRGIGFDATCSLVALDSSSQPVTVSPDGNDAHNVIVWMDHRANSEAEEINAGRHDVLRYSGGTISLEMQTPKLLWIKRNLPRSWARSAHFFDLPDWLVYRATGVPARSLCSTVCKWTYRGHFGDDGEGWDETYLAAIGLEDLTGAGRERIGSTFAAPGTPAGSLSERAAKELGLSAGIAVSASLIDAYAGALGTMGVELDDKGIGFRLAMIAGTSTCHIAVSPDPAFVPGVWGPYHSVLLPGFWVNEAGQSVAGALIDRVIAGHSASAQAHAIAQERGVSVFSVLDDHLETLGLDGETVTLSANRHVLPDFHGNRSPLADPSCKGAVSGLDMDVGLDDLALHYLTTIQALAYGTRHIIEALRNDGVGVELLVVSGGLARNKLFLRENADATGCSILVPDQSEPVLVGSAMLGAVAAGAYRDVETAMVRMGGTGTWLHPRGGKIRQFHDCKYQVFRRMQKDHQDYAAIMAGLQT